jgi:hypothetical protein
MTLTLVEKRGDAIRIFVVSERYGALAQAWLAAMAFGLWSALAAVCLWDGV